ncbi:MAG: ABC transporter permease [Elusimicrobiota bacterium]|nr:ABC transporter permease [Elusimicrobiota bacterium]
MAPLIELRGVTKTYFVGGGRLDVLNGIDLTIEAGEFVAIMGPSGSGKSTLTQILGLLDRPTSGSYKLMGLDVSALSDDEGAALRSRTIGFVFQMFNLLARTSALDNVGLPMLYTGDPGRAERAAEVLREIGLGDRLDHAPNQLSGGQQQRVAIARALVNKPRLIFADEPTGNLASDQAEEILGRLVAMNDAGITLVMVTHELDIAAHAKRIIKIKDGLVVSDEKNEQRRASPAPAGARAVMADGLVCVPPSRELSLEEFSEHVRSALGAIRSNKLRSALSMLGILIGVTAVIAMLAIGKGAQKSVETQLSSLGSNLVMLFPRAPRDGHGGARGASGSFSRLAMDDVAAIRRAHPGVLRSAGEVSGNVQAVFGDKNVNTSLTGAEPVYADMRNAQAYHGRFFTAEENEQMARVALLGPTVVTALFGDADPVGRTINVNSVKFKVIGVLPRKGSGGFQDQDDKIVVPLKTAMKKVLGRQYLGMVSIETAGPDQTDAVIESVRSLMRKRHRLPDYKDDDFTLRNMAEIQAALTGTSKIFSLLLGIVAAISLVVGGIGIMNIMLVSVSERTREIGLRKAIGATRRAVLIQFLIEAVAMSTCGGLLGIALGMAIAFGMAYFAGWAAVVTPQSVLLAFVFSAGTGIVFGFWPARKASLLSPIEALRYE